MLKKTILSLLFCISLVNADENTRAESDNFDDFMKAMQETSELAVKNKIAADHAPGIISVLKYDDMKRMGVHDLYEALELIPSVDVVVNKTGTRNLVFRGVGAVDGSGKVKVMLNGVEQNSAASGLVHFDLPIEMIDRIEVIRGPVSALYGEYAFSGMINIVTKKDANYMFTKHISNNGDIIGAIANYKDDDFSISAVASYDGGDGLKPTATDSRGTTADVETLRKNRTLLANVTYKDVKLKTAVNEAQKGEMWGIADSGVLPANDGDKNFEYDYKTVELSYKFHINSNLWIEPKIGYFNYKYWFNLTEMGTSQLPPVLDIPTKINAETAYEKKYAKLDLSSKMGMHNLLFGIEASNTSQTDYDVKTTQPKSGVKETTNGNNSNRDLFALYLHDNIAINDSLSMNIGVRYDKYKDNNNSELGGHLSPRAAFVYDMDRINIFKLQYAESFRMPTFLEEQHGARKDETNKMVEAQYIFKKENRVFRTTLFYAHIDSFIASPASKVYLNETDTIVNYGTELEYTQNFDNEFLLFSNLTYVKVKYQDTNKELPFYAPWLGNIALSYKPYSIFSSTLKARYIGAKRREARDNRGSLRATTVIDLAFRYMPISVKGLDISFGIKDITDEKIKSPSKIYTDRMNNIHQTYADDFDTARRSYYVGLDYRF